jgi:hypothetical protein
MGFSEYHRRVPRFAAAKMKSTEDLSDIDVLGFEFSKSLECLLALAQKCWRSLTKSQIDSPEEFERISAPGRCPSCGFGVLGRVVQPTKLKEELGKLESQVRFRRLGSYRPLESIESLFIGTFVALELPERKKVAGVAVDSTGVRCL